MVVDVKDDGAAADKGLKPGDVIIDAGHQPIQGPHDLVKAVEKARSGGSTSLLLRVENPQGIRYVVLPLNGAHSDK